LQYGKFHLGEFRESMKKLYVGNVAFTATEDEVRELFAQHGSIESLAWITDRDTGRFRGFCFIEMEDSAANAAIENLDGNDLQGRPLRVNEARPREDRGGGRRGGGGGRYSDRGRDRW
jgi:cold-inducible RNA-binding protein